MSVAAATDLDVVIRDTLREVRRGIATARSNNQQNPAAGMMVDLPEFVEFEIQVITGHQVLSRLSSDSDAINDNGTDVTTDSLQGNENEVSSSSESGSRSGIKSQSETSQSSKSNSSKAITQDNARNARVFTILNEDTGSSGGSLAGGGLPAGSAPSVSCA